MAEWENYFMKKMFLPSDVITLKACLYSSFTCGACYKVMMECGNYDLVREFFGKMKRSGEVPKLLLIKEDKVDEAVEAVRDMERRGVIRTASVDKIRSLPHARPLEFTFAGMIKSSMDGGHIDDCICIFEYMKDHCAPNIGAINTMLKVYGQNDMFTKAKVLFDEVKVAKAEFCATAESGNSSVVPDMYTYNSMLEASASAQQWVYFEHVYREMIIHGYQLDQNKLLSLLVKASRAGKNTVNGPYDGIDDDGNVPNISRIMTEGAESENDILVGSQHTQPETFAFNRDQVSGGGDNDSRIFRPQNSDIEDGISSYADKHECIDNLALDKSSNELDEELWDDGRSEDDDSEGMIDRPSAYEILDEWKEMRKEDGSLLHSELGCGSCG
ncbi:hypothetical protein Fmac_027221 [Flemingia macrophylla]|uniref:Pentatricopeptide repeat-containing protein n=1 Tax=Flemingia macrophylla TaxID=520843 RepID=A0ABD1LH35_9FABA